MGKECMSEATWWGAAVSGSAEVRPSASTERNEGGVHTHAMHTYTKTTHQTCAQTPMLTQVKSIFLTEQQREQDSCVHQIAQVTASLTLTDIHSNVTNSNRTESRHSDLLQITKQNQYTLIIFSI